MSKQFTLKSVIKTYKEIPKILNILWETNRVYILFITGLSILSGLIPAGSIYTTQNLINKIQTGIGREFTYVLIPLLMYISITFFGYSISLLNGYVQNLFRLQLEYRLNVIILERAKALELADIENSETYDKFRRAQNDVGDKPYRIFSTLIGLLSQTTALISSAIFLLMWKPWIVIPIVIVSSISTIYMTRLGYEQYTLERDRSSEKRKSWYISHLLGTDIAFKEIKLYGIGDYFINDFKWLNQKFMTQDKKIIQKRSRMSLIFEIVDQIIGGIALLIIIKSAYLGEILIGSTVGYIRSLSNLKVYTEGILGSLSTLYESALYINQLFEYLEMKTSDHEQDQLELNSEIECIEFKNVSFKYEGRKNYALNNVSFKIKKDEKISLVGENGSGKSTLVKLLAAFYDTYEGEILINGIELKNINKTCYRQKIGVVLQDFNKYELTCRENIGIGEIRCINNDELLEEALEKSGSKEFVSLLPKGLDNQLGVWFEDGVQLSGGQWQRLAIGRAFLKKSECYIFDEPSSALDPVSEADVFKKTLKMLDGRIGIFISHRLFNLRKFSSRILVLREGSLIEEGTHEILMSTESHYRYLYNLQNELDEDEKEIDYVTTA